MTGDLRNRASKAKSSVVKITIFQQENGQMLGSTGSGFVAKGDGIVVSNSHVVISDDPSNTIIRFADDTEKKCTEIICRDKNHDFIILRIETGKYVPLDLGSYDDVMEGDYVYFCGYPLRSNHHAIHGGVISSKFSEKNIDIIQIDGSVNSGNSGGPLLNLNDKVIGIITKKAGGIDEKLMEISRAIVTNRATTMVAMGVSLGNGRQTMVDPIKSLAELTQIIHDYTSVGIGYAFSIEYAKMAIAQA